MQVYDNGAWRTVTGAWVMDSGAWRQVTNAEVAETYEDPYNVGSYITDWHTVEGSNFGTPTAAVPNVTIGKGPELMGLSEHECAWSGSDPAGHSNFSVRVEWHVNEGIGWYQDGTDLVGPSGTSAKRDYDVSWDIYCVVYYVNTTTGATGPTTQTATI